jgi:hypothetical protein
MKSGLFRSLFALAAIAALGACDNGSAARTEPILHHVHGLAFTPDGGALIVPAHIGIAVYRDGRWSRAPGPLHDFMGFSVTRQAIYTSGHPAPGSALRNPLGLMKSVDGGKTWRSLGLVGEADFHEMAAGFRTNVVYVVNTEPNSRMPRPGLYYTTDDGKTWTRSAAAGLAGQLINVAVHPTEAGTVAAAATGGLHLSRDFGASFRRLGRSYPVTAVLFDLDGKHVYFVDRDAGTLQRVSLDGRENAALRLPEIEKDFVLYIAQNPARPNELAFATRARHVFLSADGGRSWKQIAREGGGHGG